MKNWLKGGVMGIVIFVVYSFLYNFFVGMSAIEFRVYFLELVVMFIIASLSSNYLFNKTSEMDGWKKGAIFGISYGFMIIVVNLLLLFINPWQILFLAYYWWRILLSSLILGIAIGFIISKIKNKNEANKK